MFTSIPYYMRKLKQFNFHVTLQLYMLINKVNNNNRGKISRAIKIKSVPLQKRIHEFPHIVSGKSKACNTNKYLYFCIVH